MPRAFTGFGVALAVFLATASCEVSRSAPNVPVTSACTNTSSSPPPPNVLLQERFDDGCLSSRGWYDNTNVLLSSVEHAPGSTNSVQFRFLARATIPTSGGATRHKFTASNSVYVSYYVKYSTNWVGSAHTYHPHEFYVLSTMDGDYDALSDDWLALYLEHNYQSGGMPRMAMQDNKAINTLLGLLPLDLIGITEDRSTGGCNGVIEVNVSWDCHNAPPWYNAIELTGPVEFQPNPGPGYKDNWNLVEAYFQLNTIINGIGQPDGVMQYWFNGALVIDRHDIEFRTGARATLQLDQLVIAPYIGDGSPVTQSMWVDDLTVATTRVGAAQAVVGEP